MGFPHKSHPKETVVLSQYFGDAEARTYKGWVKRGGYEALAQALKMEPNAVTDIVKESGLRGRGGAGFPTGLKWTFMPKEKKKTHYLCVNADESEPGTFKDREIMRWTPHAVLEGTAIAAHAIRAEIAYIYIRGEFTEPWTIMSRALEEANAAGVFGGIKVYLHRGAGAYICGEETALMNSIEGKRGNPRIKPPFPAAAGLFGLPTTINNVETLAAVPHIIKRGAAWYKGLCLSNPKSTGTKLFSVCGHVQRPGNYELTMGFPLKALLYDAVHLDLGAAQRVFDQSGRVVAPDGELHQASGSSAHACNGARQVGADVVAVDSHQLIARLKPRLLRRRPLYGPQHFHHPVLGADFDAYAGIGAHGAQADFLELLAVEVGRVRIECGDHAAQRLLHQGVIVDVVHVVALDALVDLGEQAGLLPRQGRAADRARGMRRD